MLVVEGVAVAQGAFRLAADFGVAAGSRVGIIGPSGAGKSTLIGAIAGFVPLSQGRILWSGQDLAELRPGDRPVTVLFQDQNLFPHLTVAQNVGLGISPALRLSAQDRARVDDVLKRVGMADLGGQRAGRLSGGEGARVALARALVRARPLLLLDEPFGALGPGLRASMLDLVGEIAEATQATILMVSHDPSDARRLCPEAIVVAAGRATGPFQTAALLDTPPLVLRDYLGK